MLFLTFMYWFLCEHVFSILLGIYLAVGFGGHMVMLFLTFWRAGKLFTKVAILFS